MPEPDLDNSRPFDVHIWSDHPEANKFVDVIWDNFFAEQYAKAGPGKRPKSNPKIQLKVLLLYLYISWIEDPDQFIGIGMSKRFYKAVSRYNALHISEIMIRIVKTLEAAGLIELHPGIEGAGRVTRIKAINLLADLFLHSALELFDIYNHGDREVIILNDRDRREIEYGDEEHPDIPEMRVQLRDYNALLLRTSIDRPDLENPVIRIEPETNNAQERVIRIGQSNKFVRRIFYRGSWELGGRFHGGWWQHVGEQQRQLIHIDNKVTTEVDYKSLHINLLYCLNATPPPPDPYEIEPMYDLFDSDEDWRQLVYHNRSITKKLMLHAINNDSEKSTFKSFRNVQKEGSIFKTLTNKKLKRMVDAFLEKNPIVDDYLYTDQGVRLMNMDGKLTARLINHFTGQKIPILTIHDSYIVQQEHSEELKEQMQLAVTELTGNDIEIPVEEGNVFTEKYFDTQNEEFDYDTFEPPEDHPIYIKTAGYLRRYELHQRWLQRLS